MKHYWSGALEICDIALREECVFDSLSCNLVEPSAELTIIVNDVKLNYSDEIKKSDKSFRVGLGKIKAKIESELKKLDALVGWFIACEYFLKNLFS